MKRSLTTTLVLTALVSAAAGVGSSPAEALYRYRIVKQYNQPTAHGTSVLVLADTIDTNRTFRQGGPQHLRIIAGTTHRIGAATLRPSAIAVCGSVVIKTWELSNVTASMGGNSSNGGKVTLDVGGSMSAVTQNLPLQLGCRTTYNSTGVGHRAFLNVTAGRVSRYTHHAVGKVRYGSGAWQDVNGGLVSCADTSSVGCTYTGSGY